MSWQLYTALCVTTLSVAVLLQRVILHRYKVDGPAFAVVFQFLVALAMLPAVLTHGFDFSGFYNMLMPIIVSGLAFGVGSVTYAQALRKVDASAFSVLFASHAVWVMLFGVVFLSERLDWLHLLGTGVIFLSIGLLVKDVRYLKPGSGFVYALFTGLLYGVAIASASYVGRHTDVLTWSLVSFVLGGLSSLLVSPKALRKARTVFTKRTLVVLLTCVVLYGLGNIAMMFAYKYGPFTLVAPLRQTGIILTTLLAVLFLRDERTDIVRKILAAITCTAGVVLLVS